ncbi:TPA: hypothetical protein ACK0K3_003199 [Enterobacter hormaechei]|uniref:hypothetical protein n=1 Tax=Enterobacterales TaxID=91347 RepID=UPI000E0E8944|nr:MULTISPECIES: hypothetical protein [Enterobacterales]ELA2348982.1 hypothetical protein [Klebsiella aerogenes]HBT2850513.1 hypothetical protein [Klebsiella pneumoniae]ELC6448527.1 hypothetical protein [Enterobacter hormaechei]ELC6462266.1 hypothetical protein [Enterobacter hormaechei]ELD3229949.1 hypothetical protein [Enterobacter hormaechei]
MSNLDLKKGERAEELLRKYFLSIGYYVLRAVEFKYHGFDITDIDLWLYSRPSPISRERTNVDIKMKKQPQALERVLWTKGLQKVLNLEKCIVATTDKRPDVTEFGIEHDVLILDGNFLSKLTSTERYDDKRISEEEFENILTLLDSSSYGGNWKQRYRKSKAVLITKLNFDGVNHLLDDIQYYLERVATSENESYGPICRALYSSISMLLILLDYSIKDIIFKEHEERVKMISEGIRYGIDGKDQAKKLLSMATTLISSFVGSAPIDNTAITAEVENQFKSIPAEIIGNHFSTTQSMKNMFHLAIAFEGLAFGKETVRTIDLEFEMKSILGVLCDFNSIDRKKVIR